MKRKFILILAVLTFCSGVYIAVRGIQTKNLNESQRQESGAIIAPKNQENENVVENTSGQTDTSKQESTNKDSDNAQKPENQTKPPAEGSETATPKKTEAKINFKVIDTINNKTILSASADIENKTVGEVTTKVLDSKGVAFRASGVGDTLYFSSIAGLAERKAGPESGWCFYVNGSKFSIGAGNYRLKKSDIIEWKYLKNGIN